MRTDDEILSRIKAVESEDFLGTIRSDLIDYLPFEAAKPFLMEGVTPDQWQAAPRDRESVLAQMQSYMDFAWGKANDNRGLSAGRSLGHMQAWLWMLGEDAAAGALRGHTHYGKPQLRAICEHFGWDWRSLDDGRWTNSEGSDGVGPDAVAALSLPWAA